METREFTPAQERVNEALRAAQKIYRMGAYRPAALAMERAADIAYEEDLLNDEIFVRSCMGRILFVAGEYAKALGCFDAVLQLMERDMERIDVERSGMEEILASAHANWVMVAAHVPGIGGAADEMLARDACLCDAMGWAEGRIGMLHSQSMARTNRHEYAQALWVAEEALALKRLDPDKGACELSHYLLEYGVALSALGHHEQALRAFAEGSELDDEYSFYYQMAVVACMQGNYAQARDYLEQQNVVCEDGDARILLGLLAQADGDDELAETELRRAFVQFETEEEARIWLAAFYGDRESLDHLVCCGGWGVEVAHWLAGRRSASALYTWIQEHSSLNARPGRLALLWALRGWQQGARGSKAERSYAQCCRAGVPRAHAVLWAKKISKLTKN